MKTMIIFGLIIIYLSLLIGISILAICIYELWFHNHPLRIGYVPSRLQDLETYIDSIMNKYVESSTHGNYVFYEIGCGSGHVLRYFAKKYKFKKVYGVELDILWYTYARLRSRQTNATIIKDNVTKYPYTHPAIFYGYLKPSILKAIVDQGGFQKSLVILLTFSIPDIDPTETIELSSSQHRIHVYDFRKDLVDK